MSFLKTFTTAASAAVIATTLSTDFAEARNNRRGPSIGTAIGIGAAIGVLGAITQSRGAHANQPSYGRNRNNNVDCTPRFINGRMTTSLRCRNQYNSYSAPNIFQPNFVQPRRGSGNGQRECVQGNYVVPCSSIPGRQFR